MRHILVYGDSLSWGIVPLSRMRFPYESRWPGVMEIDLNAKGLDVRVIEDCLNARRTVWDDPYKAGRNGLVGLATRIEICSPLSLVILLLGTNDFQSMHPFTATHSAQGIAALVNAIRTAPIEPGLPVPPILIVAPPPAGEAKGPLAWKFHDAPKKSVGLAAAYRDMAKQLECSFFDAGSVTTSSPVDGIHLDEDQQIKLGRALANHVSSLLRK